jgi:EEF1A lysine methyltransferase 1
VFYNYKEPENIPAEYHHTFDYVVIDPPFIVEEVWEKYIEAAKILLLEEPATTDDADENKSPVGKCLLSTIPDNAELLEKLMGAKPQKFQPSIPHLIYQYDFFCNYETTTLNQLNPEIVVYGAGAGKGGYDPTKDQDEQPQAD